jgi:hypothetical protein
VCKCVCEQKKGPDQGFVLESLCSIILT